MATPYDIAADEVADAFARIEEELLESMFRNLGRHEVDEVAEGFEWTQWQAAQIAELESFTRSNALRMGPRFDALNDRIDRVIAEAYERGKSTAEAAIIEAARAGADIGEQGFLRLPKERLGALLRATHGDMVRAEYATLRKAEDVYRQTIFTAQTYAVSGAGTYGRAIDMATHDFVSRGINGIRYRNGSMHGIEEYSRMAVRTAAKRAALVAEGDARREWGVHTVFVNYRVDACPECMEWVGRVLIDDVYSGGTADEAREAGYPLLSEAMAQGLFHPNCRDTCSTYFEGVSELPERPTKAERRNAEQAEIIEQWRDKMESEAERYARLSRFSLDFEDKRRFAQKAGEFEDRAEVLGDDVSARIAAGLGNKGFTERQVTEIAGIAADAPETAREVFERHLADMRFDDLHDAGNRGFYRPTTKGITINVQEVSQGRRWERPWEVLFHEFGHLIDHAEAAHSWGRISEERGLGSSIKKEVQALLRRIKKEQGFDSIDSAKDFLTREVWGWYREDPKQLGGVSDLIGGATRNKSCGCIVGHSTGYWNSGGMQQLSTEAFAEFFQCEMCNPAALERMKQYFPKSYELFTQILEEIANG